VDFSKIIVSLKLLLMHFLKTIKVTTLFIVLCIIVATANQTLAQNRMYLTLSGGVAIGLADERAFSYAPGPAYGFTWTSESRISGSLYSLIGLGLEYTDNQSREDVYYQSSVQQTNLNIPLLLRFNTGNANRVYMDIGVVPSYMLRCNLLETGSYGESFTGEVSSLVSPIRMGLLLGSTISFGVFNIGWQLNWKQIDGNTSELAKKWADAGSNSTFVANGGNSHAVIFSLNTGIRIK
jgi:hypothetical protein